MTFKLEDVLLSLSQHGGTNLGASLSSASSAGPQTVGMPCISTKSKWRRSDSSFSVEATVNGYHAYKERWALKGILVVGKFWIGQKLCGL